jgi:hypothetical protein
MKGHYLPTNLEHCLAIYGWTEKLTIFDMVPLFERITALIGSPPDDVSMWRADEWKSKGYKYRNFWKLDAIHQEDWVALSYDWRRQPDARAYLAASINVSLERLPTFSVHIDEAATADVELVYEAVISEISKKLSPTYGIGFAVPYSWQAYSFMAGQGSGYAGPETDLHYNSAEAFCIRGLYAGRVLVRDPTPLDKQLRDVFEINLLSSGHLNHLINGERLETWITTRGKGTLRKITPITWRWDIPKKALPEIRRSAITANLVVDPFWTKLGWIDN